MTLPSGPLRESFNKVKDADLIVIGVLVENIERVKARFRETVNFYNQNKTLTPKPYFALNNNKLKESIFNTNGWDWYKYSDYDKKCANKFWGDIEDDEL